MGDLMPWHQNWLVDMELNRVDLVKEGANSLAFIRLIKSKGGKSMPTFEEIVKALKPEHQTVVNEYVQGLQAEVQKARAEAQAAQEAFAKAKNAEGPAPGASTEEILKSIQDPAVRTLLEQQIAKAKIAEEELRKAREAQLEQEAIAKAKEVSHIGAAEDDLKELYKSLKSVDVELCDKVFGILKSASAVARDGDVFKEIGKSAGDGGSSASEDQAWNKIEQAADVIVKEKNISKAAAIREVINSNPALYDEYLRSQRA